jgi:hypothetical protein
MAVLKTKARKAAWHLVINGKVKFPINDKRHARAALGRINQAKPPLTASQKAAVRARAHKLLGTKKS